jgi:hypothetical protein
MALPRRVNDTQERDAGSRDSKHVQSCQHSLLNHLAVLNHVGAAQQRAAVHCVAPSNLRKELGGGPVQALRTEGELASHKWSKATKTARRLSNAHA